MCVCVCVCAWQATLRVNMRRTMIHILTDVTRVLNVITHVHRTDTVLLSAKVSPFSEQLKFLWRV